MVTTKLSEVVGKGWGWYSGPSPPTAGETSSSDSAPHPPTPKASGSSSRSEQSSQSNYWDYAHDAAEQTYSTLSGYVGSIGWSPSSGGISDTSCDTSPIDPLIMENMPVAPKHRKTGSLLTSPTVLNLFHNPYVVVRGGGNQQAYRPSSSMEAIRSFISAVPTLQLESTDSPSDASSMIHQDSSLAVSESSSHGITPVNLVERGTSGTIQSSPSETASQLAEGTLRAFRDIALDEAVELHQSLRYWSYRWERPLLSWLEAGPRVWLSEEGYQHQMVGQKVSQIQAVLARRCATIGDLQSHLLRAGWQRGVAQWGVLGAGGEWATVAGGDGRMSESFPPSPSPHVPMIPPPSYSMQRVSSEYIDDMIPPGRPQLPRKAPSSNVCHLPQHSRHNQLYYTNVFVKNNDGGHIMIDDPALAEWSVDAMSLVRLQLFRAANGQIVLPYNENWAEGDDQSRLSYDVAGSLIMDAETAATDETVAGAKLPLWASLRLRMEDEDDEYGNDGETEPATRVQISDLPLLVNEVSELLDIMDSVMQMQRARRLEKLKPLNWWRRNWYVGAVISPPLLYFSFKAANHGYGLEFLNNTAKQFTHFFREHVVDPFMAMYDEFTKGTVDISDREARNVAIKNLRKMIRSWLDETHPDMPLKERKRMARAMDISLIEAEKEESMKTIYNINSVIRMSFIEAQFLKKVRIPFFQSSKLHKGLFSHWLLQ